MIRLFLFLLLTAGLRQSADAAPVLPKGFSAIGVMLETDSGQTGTGFFWRTEKDEYLLVSARHVLCESGTWGHRLKCKSIQVTFYSDESLAPSSVRTLQVHADGLESLKRVLIHPTADVIALDLGTLDKNGVFNLVYCQPKGAEPIAVGIPVNASLARKFADVNLAEEVVVIGYPRSIGDGSHPQMDPLAPLLRKGIVSGKNFRQDKLILDTQVFPGNSGGPAVIVGKVDPFTTVFSVAGIVVEFIPFVQIWENKQFRINNADVSNSGYTVVEPIDRLFEIIPQSPIPLPRTRDDELGVSGT